VHDNERECKWSMNVLRVKALALIYSANVGAEKGLGMAKDLFISWCLRIEDHLPQIHEQQTMLPKIRFMETKMQPTFVVTTRGHQ
jgi:hypothetical protein